MKTVLIAFLILIGFPLFASSDDITIPERYIAPIKTTDLVEVTGTNDRGGAEDFSIHNAKAIGQFVQFLTSDRYESVPKNLKPEFKSLSSYKVRLSCNGATILEFQVIGDAVLDLPDETVFYMESDRHSDNLMAPLLRLR
jgi:hypothetical protein